MGGAFCGIKLGRKKQTSTRYLLVLVFNEDVICWRLKRPKYKTEAKLLRALQTPIIRVLVGNREPVRSGTAINLLIRNMPKLSVDIEPIIYILIANEYW